MNYTNLTNDQSFVFSYSEVVERLETLLADLLPHTLKGVLFCKRRNRIISTPHQKLYELNVEIPAQTSIIPPEFFTPVSEVTEPVSRVLYQAADTAHCLVTQDDVEKKSVICHVPNEYRAKYLADEVIQTMVDTRLRYKQTKGNVNLTLVSLLEDPMFFDEEFLHQISRKTVKYVTGTNGTVLQYAEKQHPEYIEQLYHCAELIHERVFFEINQKIQELLNGFEWRLVTTRTVGDKKILVRHHEDYRVVEYMRLYGHKYP